MKRQRGEGGRFYTNEELRQQKEQMDREQDALKIKAPPADELPNISIGETTSLAQVISVSPSLN